MIRAFLFYKRSIQRFFLAKLRDFYEDFLPPQADTCTFGLFIELLAKSPSNGGVALCGETTQKGFVDFQ